MKRREFIAVLGSAAVLSPIGVHAQHTEAVRRVGVLMVTPDDDPDARTWIVAFRRGLERRGWSDGKNLRIDARFAATQRDRIPGLAKELLALKPDVILTQSTVVSSVLQKETRTVPIVFVHVSDPIGAGLVSGLSRPGGNITGLLHYEATIVGKWLAMLKEIAPRLTGVTMLGNRNTTAFDYFMRSAEAAAPALSIRVKPGQVANAEDIERTIEALAREPDTALMLPPDATTIRHHDLIVKLAARYRLPAVYPMGIFVTAGGLMSYGTDQDAMFQLAASYVDRILRGDKPSDLPVQAPTRYQTAINLKTARDLGLTVPAGLLVAADEVIE